MTRNLAALALAASLALAACSPAADAPAPAPTPAPPLVTGELNEDEHGWNCWIDGNGACGDALEETAPGCLTNTDDGYTMCADGRAYYLVDGVPTDVVLRVAP